MKIGTLSDLHIDRNDEFSGLDLERTLAEMVIEKGIECLLIAGDISNHYETTHAFIKRVEQLSGVPVLFVPGNHDYWARDHTITDTNALNQFFNDQSYSLVGKPKLIDENWAIVGTPGWYDYGYGNSEKYDVAAFEKKQYGFASWNDRHYIDWGKTDQQVSQDMLDQLYRDLKSVENRNIILMTHVATHPEFVMPLPHRIYNYANAFLGARSYEMVYTDFPTIKYSIMGHVHFRKTVKDKKRTYITACVGNHKHWKIKDFRTQINKSLVCFTIN
ncbi:MAG: metallophosphoesterase [Alkalibacterium sp.]|nr:metallophosphoesterase [Alkalibacterium sp.]